MTCSCPWWTNSSCAGTSFIPADGFSSSSSSTDKSHRVTWSSAPAAAKHESSVGCHSIEVMGAVCQEKEATGVGAGDLVLQRWNKQVSEL